MRGAIPPLPSYVFMEWCLVKHRDNFTFTFYLCVCLPVSLSHNFISNSNRHVQFGALLPTLLVTFVVIKQGFGFDLKSEINISSYEVVMVSQLVLSARQLLRLLGCETLVH